MLQVDPTTRPSTDTAEPNEACSDREKALAPYLAQLAANDSPDGEEASIPSSISVAGQTLSLDPWERGVLEKFGSGVDTGGRPWPSLVAQGLAFAAKCLSVSGQLETDSEVLADQETELVDDATAVAAAGVAVFAELQSSINQLIRDGRMKDAKQLGTFRNKVGQSVATMRNLMGNEALPRVEVPSANTRTAPARTVTLDIPGERVSQKPAPTQFKRDPAPVWMTHRSEVGQRKLVRPLLVVMGVCLAAWIGFTVTRTRYVAPPGLTIEQFRHVEAIRRVEAKYPSVFVKLDKSAWSRIPERDRQEVIREIGLVAEQADYSGAQVWTTDGVAVGRWLKKTGVYLVAGTGEGG